MLLQELAQLAADSTATEIPWYYLTLAFALAGAALEHGCNTLFTGWERELKLPIWFSVIGDVTGIVLASVLGATVGSIVWQWHLGSAVAFTGAIASRLVISLVRAKLGIATKSKDDDSQP